MGYLVYGTCISHLSLETMKQKATSGARRQLLLESTVDTHKYGTIVDMAQFTAGGQNVICLATTRGKLCGLDLRCNDIAWELTNNAKFGEWTRPIHC